MSFKNKAYANNTRSKVKVDSQAYWQQIRSEKKQDKLVQSWLQKTGNKL